MSETTVTLFDTETTGFPATPITGQPLDVQPYILQLHAVTILHDDEGEGFHVMDTFSSFFSGAPYVSKRITEINGITMEKLEGAPSWVDVRDQFFDMCLTAGTVCAHNFQFDARMVHVEQFRSGVVEKPFEGIKQRCSLLKSRVINSSAKSHNLGKLHQHLFKEELKDAHTADGDVAGLIRIYMDLVKKGAWVKKTN